MRKDSYYMLAFDSTHQAIRAQRLLKPLLPICVMPTLRAVQAGCGISLRIEEADFATLQQALHRIGETDWRLYAIQGDRVQKIIDIHAEETKDNR